VPRTAVALQDVTRAGLAVTEAAGDNVNGNQFTNDGKTILRVRNSSGGSLNVTITTPGTVDGLAVADRVVAVGAGVTTFIGPFPVDQYNQGGADAGQVFVDVTAATMFLSVMRIPL